MSNRISTLLLRNLSDVFGENDPLRRRAAIDEIFHEDAVFYDPKGGEFRGRDEIDRIAGVIKATIQISNISPSPLPRNEGMPGAVGIWQSRQTARLRGNRFHRRQERSHCFGLPVFRQPTLNWDSAGHGTRITNVCPLPGLWVSSRTIAISPTMPRVHPQIMLRVHSEILADAECIRVDELPGKFRDLTAAEDIHVRSAINVSTLARMAELSARG